MPKLILMTKRGTSKQVALGAAETRIGRMADNDIVIDEERISRSHAVLTMNGPSVTITDLHSLNGVFVNGTKIDSQILMDGDNIAMGNCTMRFLAGEKNFMAVESLQLMTNPGRMLSI